MGIKFDGDFTVTAPRERVYAVLSDPQQFAPLLPTYQSYEAKDERTTDVTVKVGVGKVRGSATVTLTLVEADEPRRAAYQGKGKVMGGAFNIDTAFELAEAEGGGTLVKWTGDLSMFGKLVALAGGLIRPIAKKDIQRLIDAIQASLSAEPSAGAPG